MSNKIKEIIETFNNAVIGLWNNFGIAGRLAVILLSPIAFAILLSLWTFKLGLKLLGLLNSEVNFYWTKWAEATTIITIILDDLIKKKIFPWIMFLWKRLIDEDYVLNKKENKLEENWFKTLLLCFITQLQFFVGLLLILTTFSSLIYWLYTRNSNSQLNLLYAWLLRFLILTPLIHRYIRYRILGKPFSWEPEKIDEWSIKGYSNWKPIIALIIIVLIALTYNFHFFFDNQYFFFNNVNRTLSVVLYILAIIVLLFLSWLFDSACHNKRFNPGTQIIYLVLELICFGLAFILLSSGSLF